MPLERLRAEIAGLAPAERDDVSRAYAFHLASFPGEKSERRDAELALFACGNAGDDGVVLAEIPGQDTEALTRALLRLEETGALALEERRAGGWVVRRTGGWTRETALRAASERIARDYRAVEPARRGSLAELVELVSSLDAGTALAKRLTAASPACSVASGFSGRSRSSESPVSSLGSSSAFAWGRGMLPADGGPPARGGQ